MHWRPQILKRTLVTRLSEVADPCEPPNTSVFVRLRRQSNSDRRDTLPSWLLSLVTHLTILVVIAALASSPGGGFGSSEPIVLTLSQYDGPEDENSSVLIQSGGQGTAPTDDEDSPIEPGLELDQVDSNRTSSPANTAEADDQTTGLRLRGSLSDAEIREQLQQPLVRFFNAAGQTKTVRIAYKPLDTPARNSASTQVVTDDALNSRTHTPIESWRMDEIVDRFIQYDIGQLRGLAGSQARWQFERLGPESIPALVRGLNKAAKIRASCPIAVITSRLDRMLSQTGDPGLIKYAIENVGRGIDFRAPHRRAVQQLAYRWRKLYGAASDGGIRNEYQGAGPPPLAGRYTDDRFASEDAESNRRWNDWRKEVAAPR